MHTLRVGMAVLEYQRKLRMQSFNIYCKAFGLQPQKSFEEMTGSVVMELIKKYVVLLFISTTYISVIH